MTIGMQHNPSTCKPRAGRTATWWRVAACALAFATWPLADVLAEPRLALIIGNSEYGSEMGRLPNPANDARLMSDALKDVGFETITLIDADQKSLKRAISDFGQKLTAMGSEATGLFFYAGHGLQVKGANYLVPVRADIRTEADVDLEAVSADTVLAQMEYAGARVNIVILDACRNNPLARGFRSQTRGLAKMDAPKGSFIAYSTAPGDVAADGTGSNSPYTAALAASIATPGKGIEEMFRDVRGRVLQQTGDQQTPWESSSLTAPFYFKTGDAEATYKLAGETSGEPETQTQVAARSIDPVETEYWEAAKTSNDAADYEAYLTKYPNGEYALLAKNRLERLKKNSAEPAPAEQQVAAIDSSASIVATQQMLYMKSKGNLRASPNKNGPVLTQLPKNAELNVTGHTADGAWWRVALDGGNAGYVHNSLVANQPSAPPVAATTAPAPASAPALAPSNENQAAVAEAPAANEVAYAAAPAMADNGTTTRGMIASNEPTSETSAQVGAAFGSFLSGIAGQQGISIPAPTRSAPQPQMSAPDPQGADQAIVSQLRGGNVQGAARSAGQAQTDDPGFWSRAAMLAFYGNGRGDLAMNMARRSVQDNSSYLYGWIWIALGEAANGGGQGSAQTGLADFGQNAWPAPIAEFMAGQRSADSLMAVANLGGDRAVQVCEAGFYGGAYLKATGDAAGATKLFNAAKTASGGCLEGAVAKRLR